MEATFIEKYAGLWEMETGNIAVSSDRSQLFICAQGTPVKKDENGKRYSIPVIIDLNKLHDHYLGDKISHIRIKKLERGDQFLITV